MRSTFHITWLTFSFVFGWFGIAPLMPLVREQLHLTKEQVGNFVCIVHRYHSCLVDPRAVCCDADAVSYTILLVLGAIPVMCIGFANDYESFLLFRHILVSSELRL